MQVTPSHPPDNAPEASRPLAADLYALMLFMRKHCNADLFEAMGVLELTITQIKLLHQLEAAGPELTLKQVAERVPLSLPAVSRTVDDLVRRGMLHRHEDDEDRRMKRISLTEEGRTVIRKLHAAQLSGVEQFTNDLTGGERELLSAALSELLRRPELAVCRPEGI